MAQQTIIDTDVHPILDRTKIAQRLPEPYRTRLIQGNSGYAGNPYWNPNGVNRRDAVDPNGQPIAADPQRLLTHYLDEQGIAAAVLNPGVVLGWCVAPEIQFASENIAAVNRLMLEEWVTVSPRLNTALTINPQDPQRAVAEIREHGSHPQVSHVYMASAARMPYGQRYYWPIYEACCEAGLPVAIHPGTEGNGLAYPATPAGHPGSYFEWHTGLLSNYIGHLISLICEGVFQEYPKLKFIMIEGGVSWLPPLMWRFDKNWKALRQTTPWMDQPPSQVIADHIRLTTQPIEEPPKRQQFHQILDMFPADKMLMFSTDFPHWDGDTPDFVGKMFPQAIRSRVMYQNALDTFPRLAAAIKEPANA